MQTFFIRIAVCTGYTLHIAVVTYEYWHFFYRDVNKTHLLHALSTSTTTRKRVHPGQSKGEFKHIQLSWTVNRAYRAWKSDISSKLCSSRYLVAGSIESHHRTTPSGCVWPHLTLNCSTLCPSSDSRRQSIKLAVKYTTVPPFYQGLSSILCLQRAQGVIRTSPQEEQRWPQVSLCGVCGGRKRLVQCHLAECLS